MRNSERFEFTYFFLMNVYKYNFVCLFIIIIPLSYYHYYYYFFIIIE